MGCSDYPGLKFAKSKMGRKRKERRRKTHSILQDHEDKRCYLCMMMNGDHRVKQVEQHHIYPGKLRQISDQNGFTCNLCPKHHRTGKHAVHKDHNMLLLLQAICQEEYEKTHTREEFVSLTGKNYIDVKPQA